MWGRLINPFLNKVTRLDRRVQSLSSPRSSWIYIDIHRGWESRRKRSPPGLGLRDSDGVHTGNCPGEED